MRPRTQPNRNAKPRPWAEAWEMVAFEQELGLRSRDETRTLWTTPGIELAFRHYAYECGWERLGAGVSLRINGELAYEDDTVSTRPFVLEDSPRGYLAPEARTSSGLYRLLEAMYAGKAFTLRSLT